MHNPESLSSDMVDLSHVLTRLNVLNDRSTVQVVGAGLIIRSSPTARPETNPFFDLVNKILLILFDGFLLVPVVP